MMVNSQVRSDRIVLLNCCLQKKYLTNKNAMLVKLNGHDTYMNIE